jgi:ribosomal protein S21
MVRRTTRLVHRNRELFEQMTLMRLEAKEQARKEWLQRARDQATRIANRHASNAPKQDGA